MRRQWGLHLTLQDDGNLVLAARGRQWATGTNGRTSRCRRKRLTPRTSRCGTPTPRAPRTLAAPAGRPQPGCMGSTVRVVVQHADRRGATTAARDRGAGAGRRSGPRRSRRARAPGAGTGGPAAPPPPPPPPPAPRTYTVVSGDTLWAISERFYGDGSKYQVIADASGISNPDLIYPGQVLTIP